MERLKCPHCGEDIDSEVGEFLMVGSPDYDDELPCPHCGKMVKIKITVEVK